MKKQTKLGLVLAAAALISVSVASLVSARGWVQNGADWYYVDNDGEYVTETIQASGNTKFYLGEDGSMQKDYFLEDYNNATYYFGSNGAMVTNTWVAIESDRTDNQGDYVPDNYWYYFQASGKAVKGTSDNPKKTTIDGKKYMFNEYGQMCTGWIDENGNVIDPDTDEDGGPFVNAWYYAGGDNDGVLRSGWVTYYDGWNGTGNEYQTDKTNLYFYFNTTNNQKYGAKDGAVTKKINGKTYAFDANGMMLSGWDQVDEGVVSSLSGKTVYFSGEDDGHQVKKGWVYAVPAESIDQSAYDDGEEKYMYFGSSGEAVTDQFKKINGKYYVFAKNGIMKTGLVIWCPNLGGSTTANHYVNKLDMDWAEGSDVLKKGKLQVADDEWYFVDQKGNYVGGQGVTAPAGRIKLHFFGDDGARKTGTNNVEFSDETYAFTSNASGHKESGSSNKKYYSLGFQLKANADIKYGIYLNSTKSNVATWYRPQLNSYPTSLTAGNYLVLNTAGSKQKNGVKKDADGNYWVMRDDGSLLGIYTVEIKQKDLTFTLTKKTAWNVTKGDAASIGSFFDAYYEIEDGTTTADIDNVAWASPSEIVSSDAGKTWTLKYYDVYSYKTDKGAKTNVFLPFGVTDNFDKTAIEGFDPNIYDQYYQVMPNNDYFLNCYWDD